jgi:hypothetical protein
VTLIQRFGSALNLNVHFHMLWLDGVYEDTTERPQRKPRLHRTRAPTSAQLTELAGTIAHRVCRHLTRKGWLEGEDESVFLSDSAAGDDGMDGLRMSSITYRIATGRDVGRKVVTLQTLPGDAGSLDGDAGKVGGFSLHAGVAAEAHESHKLEKLCRYITRPAISEQRLSISPQGRVRYQLKTPWRTERAQRVKAQRAKRALPRSGRMAPRMSNGMRWTSSPSWPHWSRRHVLI